MRRKEAIGVMKGVIDEMTTVGGESRSPTARRTPEGRSRQGR